MPPEFKYDVFLSHNQADKPKVRQLAEGLRAAGLRVWFDEWIIKPGDDVYLAIERGLEAARVQVLCLSPAALGSDWVTLERSTVLFRDPTNGGRRFIPLLLADCELPDTLRRYKYVDFRQDADAAYEELLTFCRGEAPSRPPMSPTSPLLKSKIEEARLAARKHDIEKAVCLWEEVGNRAEKEGNKATEIRAKLAVAQLHLRSGGDLDDVLSVLNKCVQDAKSVDLGDERSKLLQLLGEAHRLKGDWDQAQGFITSALEHSRSLGNKLNEGWALLALGALEKTKDKQVVSTAGLDSIQKAYDCFSSVYVSGDEEKQRTAKEGFAVCHSWRAAIFDHLRLDDAMAEYARALEVFRELGGEHEWDVADILFRRGDLHARADDPRLAGEDLVAAAELFKRLSDRTKEAECVMAMAELLDRVGHRLESKEYYEAAVAIAMQQKNRKKGAEILFRYACKLWALREYEQAKSILTDLLSADCLRPSQRLDILKMLCLAAKATGQQQELELHSQAALDIIDEQIVKATSADERRHLIISKGQSLEELGQDDRALACFRRGIEAFEAVNDRHALIECWSHIGQLMGKTRKRKEEREAYEKVLSLIGDERDSFHRPMVLAMLAQLDIFEQRFDEASKRLDRAEQENAKLLIPMVSLIVQDLRSKLPPKSVDSHLDFDAFVMSAKGETSTKSFQEWAGGERVTLAIVFTDVVGSTALGEEIRDEAMNEVRRAHFAQSRKLIGQFEGREIKTIGDSFMAAFKCVNSALDYAQALHGNTGHPQVHIRAGIHIGPMHVEEGDVFGGTVNFAARVVGAIKGAEIWLSDRAKEDIDRLGAAQHKHLKWERHDGVDMKGFPGVFTLWSLKKSPG